MRARDRLSEAIHYSLRGGSLDCFVAIPSRNDGARAFDGHHAAAQRIFPACQIRGTGGASMPPTQSWAELQPRRRQWDKTSEVPEVHGALRWWALSKAVKPHFWKPYWRERAPSAMPAASTPELRSAIPAPRRGNHKMGVGLSAATTSFMGDSYTFIDSPGSIEFAHDMRAALPAVDAAVVVCEADEKKLPQLQIILRELEDLGIPRFLFLNKIDAPTSASARRSPPCSRPRACRWCCGRFRSGTAI